MSLTRVRALVVFGVLALVALGTVGFAIAQDGSPAQTTAGPCAGTTEVPFPDPDQVKVRVFNGTEQSGLATTIADDLRQRGFVISTVGNDPTSRKPVSPAEIRYGAAGAGAAQLLKAYLVGAKAVQDDRKDDLVDVAVGSSKAEVAEESDAKSALAQLPRATVPCPSASASAASAVSASPGG
jgi:hypothetical protein